MDKEFSDHSFCISTKTKVKLFCNVKRTTVKVTYTDKKQTSTSTSIKLTKGAVIFCLCAVDFIDCVVKIELESDCYISNLHITDTHYTATIEGRYWYKKLTNYKPYSPVPIVVNYIYTADKWVRKTIPSCASLMVNEICAISNILSDLRGFDKHKELDFEVALAEILVDTHYQNWYSVDQQARKSRKLVWDWETNEASPELFRALESVGLFKLLIDRRFTRTFTIYFSPGTIEYRIEDGPIVTLNLSENENTRYYTDASIC